MGIIAPVGRIIVKEITSEDNMTKGGVILPTKGSDPNNKTRLGEVVSNGIFQDYQYDDLYAVGTRLYFGKYAGAHIEHDGEDYTSITKNEVAAICQ